MDAVAASKAASHTYSADASPLQVNAPAFMMPSTFPEVGTNGKGVDMTSPQNVATMPSTAAGWHGALNPHLKTSILGAHEAQRRANLEDFDQQQDRFKYNFGEDHPFGLWVSFSAKLKDLQDHACLLDNNEALVVADYLLAVMKLTDEVVVGNAKSVTSKMGRNANSRGAKIIYFVQFVPKMFAMKEKTTSFKHFPAEAIAKIETRYLITSVDPNLPRYKDAPRCISLLQLTLPSVNNPENEMVAFVAPMQPSWVEDKTTPLPFRDTVGLLYNTLVGWAADGFCGEKTTLQRHGSPLSLNRYMGLKGFYDTQPTGPPHTAVVVIFSACKMGKKLQGLFLQGIYDPTGECFRTFKLLEGGISMTASIFPTEAASKQMIIKASLVSFTTFRTTVTRVLVRGLTTSDWGATITYAGSECTLEAAMRLIFPPFIGIHPSPAPLILENTHNFCFFFTANGSSAQYNEHTINFKLNGDHGIAGLLACVTPPPPSTYRAMAGRGPHTHGNNGGRGGRGGRGNQFFATQGRGFSPMQAGIPMVPATPLTSPIDIMACLNNTPAIRQSLAPELDYFWNFQRTAKMQNSIGKKEVYAVENKNHSDAAIGLYANWEHVVKATNGRPGAQQRGFNFNSSGPRTFSHKISKPSKCCTSDAAFLQCCPLADLSSPVFFHTFAAEHGGRNPIFGHKLNDGTSAAMGGEEELIRRPRDN